VYASLDDELQPLFGTWNGFLIPVPACSSVDQVMIAIERNLFVDADIQKILII